MPAYDERAPLAVPIDPDHDYDFPPDVHVGPAAALGVPCSDGPASLSLDHQDLISDRALIAAESPIEPGRQMEAGTEFDTEACAKLAPLFTPMRSK